MSIKSTSDRYGLVAIIVHWLSAVLIVGMIAAGITSAMSEDDALKIAILRVHAPVGMAVLALTVFRLLWWMFADRKPADVAGQTEARALASRWVHRLLYLMLIVMPVSGSLVFGMSGAPEIIFEGAPGPLPDFASFEVFYVHFFGGIVLLGLLALHVGGALYHHVVLKDRLLARMGVGR
jgi:cytochrome b561